MFPVVHGVPTYFAMWALAAIVSIPVGVRLTSGRGLSIYRSGVALIWCALLILVGSKLMYLAESALFPTDDYVPAQLRGPFHGFRIPGGMILLGVGLPIVCRAMRLNWRVFGDAAIPAAALAVVFIRLGCFANGCCFGHLTSAPWGVQFPIGSAAFAYQSARGYPIGGGGWSFAVHPLQLYFAAAASGIFVALGLGAFRALDSGLRYLAFFALFFGSTALLEPLRANSLTLNMAVVPTTAAATSLCFILAARKGWSSTSSVRS